jgi:Flp pilus assembly protein TadD
MTHPQPIHFVISEQEFDRSLLPKTGRQLGTDAFRQSVARYFRAQYAELGGETTVEFEDGAIAVTWIPGATDRDPMAAIVERLNAGDYQRAKPMLETLLQANPRDHDALYNLGIVYSDEGRLEEARDLLSRATEVDPRDANAWTALGVAALRAQDTEAARPALERAVGLEPENPHALRTLGTLYAMTGEHARAAATLRSALRSAPDDPVTLLTLGQALIAEDPASHAAEADALLSRVLALAPQGALAEKAEAAKRRIANRAFRAKAVGGLRPDAVMYCLAALERFEPMSQQQLAPILLELGALGQAGLKVNDPGKTYTLRSLPGAFSGLEIACLLHVGLKRLDPAAGSGMDLDAEYQAARALHGRDPAG